MTTVLKPRQPVPDLAVSTLGGQWVLADQQPENFTLLVFYRGLHCPICKMYLRELNRTLDEFRSRGVGVIAISSDERERAEQARDDWDIGDLTIGYGLTKQQAQDWGLHRSAGKGKTSIGIEEPAEFSEPGLFLVRADGTLYFSNISTMPFARPDFKAILTALDFIAKNDYPARGELV